MKSRLFVLQMEKTKFKSTCQLGLSWIWRCLVKPRTLAPEAILELYFLFHKGDGSQITESSFMADFFFQNKQKNKAEGQMKEFVRTEGYLKKIIILKSVTVYFLTLLNMIEFTFGASVNIMSISKLCMFLFSIRKIILIFIFLSVQNN